jgi:hypothetical protein
MVLMMTSVNVALAIAVYVAISQQANAFCLNVCPHHPQRLLKKSAGTSRRISFRRYDTEETSSADDIEAAAGRKSTENQSTPTWLLKRRAPPYWILGEGDAVTIAWLESYNCIQSHHFLFSH